MRPSSSALWAARASIALTAAFVPLAVQLTPASAQALPVSPPTTGVETPAGTVGVGEGGIDATLGSGEMEVGVGAGPGGVTVRLPGSTAALTDPGSASSPSAPTSSAPNPPVRKSPSASPEAGESSEPAAADGRAAQRKQRTRGASRSASRAGGTTEAVSAQPTAARGKSAQNDGNRSGVAQFIERIPTAVRAGIVALGLIAFALWLLWVRARRELERNAFVDPATGISNPSAFMPVLEREIKRAERYERPFGLVMLEVVERRGGLSRQVRLTPRTVRRATSAISGRVRDSDTVVQLSHNRFAVLCPESAEGSVETMARSLERCFEEQRVHVKVGTAELRPDDSGPGDLVARALSIAPDAEGAEGTTSEIDAHESSLVAAA
jgi:GGDEF domain-containing protein